MAFNSITMFESESHFGVRPGADRRRLPRQPLALACVIDSDGQQFRGCLRDVSAAGAFVETDCPSHIGAQIAIREHDAGLIAGHIVRRETTGIAVHFRYNEQAVTFALRAVGASMAPRLADMGAM
jgi:hypothetical protein